MLLIQRKKDHFLPWVPVLWCVKWCFVCFQVVPTLHMNHVVTLGTCMLWVGGGKEPYFKSVSESIRHISNSCTKGAYFDLNKVNMIDAESRRSPSNLSNTNPHLFCLEDLENLGCADECRYKNNLYTGSVKPFLNLYITDIIILLSK